MAKTARIKSPPQNGALEASFSQDWLDKNTETWLVGGYWRGLHNRQRIFDFFNLVNLYTAQKQLKLGGKLPTLK